MDEDSDGVRIKIVPCVKEQFRQRIAATKVLGGDFYVPNRAQLMLNFLQKHGDRVVKETSGPRNVSQGLSSFYSTSCANLRQVLGSDCVVQHFMLFQVPLLHVMRLNRTCIG